MTQEEKFGIPHVFVSAYIVARTGEEDTKPGDITLKRRAQRQRMNSLASLCGKRRVFFG